MAGLIWLVALLLILALPMPGRSGTTEGNPRDLTIRMDQDMLTVKAKEVPHRRLLEELAKRLKFELIIAGPLEDQRSLEIDARPWEEALKKALSPASWAFVYDSSGGEPRLAKVFVFPSKDNASGSGRPSPSPGRVAAPVPTPPPAPQPQDRQAARPLEQGSDASLTEMLEAEDEETRALALVGLAAMGDEQAVPALRKALQDKEAWIRETAVEALAEIGGEQAIQGLQQALRDENEDVRKAAQEALIRLQPNPQ
jgi:HEAT repeats